MTTRPAIEATQVLERAGFRVVRGGKYGNRALKVFAGGRHVTTLVVQAGCVDRKQVATLVEISDNWRELTSC